MIKNFPDRIYVDAIDHDKYNELRSKSDSEILLPFRSLKDIFMFAGAIGWSFNERLPFVTRKELIFHHYLDEKYDKPLILAAYFDSFDDENFSKIDYEAATKLFEEYANYGFKFLYNDTLKGKHDKVSAIVRFLIELKHI